MKITILLFFFPFYILLGQELKQDSIPKYNLDEVIIVSQARLKNEKQTKPLATLDEYLEKSGAVSMIKRGNYAWEASMNNMLSERLSITIDGMQIFGACTDKMDPITSYVDVSNLDKININSGQHGSQNGATIGGGIDLNLQKGNFNTQLMSLGIDSGYESNNNAKIISGELNYSNKRFYVNTDVIYRNAGNYFAGNNVEVLFSQYEKFNSSTSIGYKTGKNSSLSATIIYDKASDVGYPALTMDVSLAEAIISSISFKKESINNMFSSWESKLYYNTITHVMDDTKRPDVPIHMDMPGWSNTAGFYSRLHGKKNKHQFLINLNGFYNKSLAEMTMYPNDPNENSMFMLTWPDIRTLYSGIYVEDNLVFNKNSSLLTSIRIGFQNASVTDDFGFNSLKIFYPDMEKSISRLLPSVSTRYSKNINSFTITTGVGYGERAPSVTEAYGFYLYNSFDNYDYVGNPNLKNEKSLEGSFTVLFKKQRISIKTETSYFYISDYIIGKTNPDLSQMTINADGVRVYTALKHAGIFNTRLFASYKIIKSLVFSGFAGYYVGKDNNKNHLPLISPFSYSFTAHYKKDFFDAEVTLTGADTQVNYSSYYGENKTQAYSVLNLNASYSFYINKTKLFLKAGIENVFDKSYSTYSDWQNIPRTGRNLFINASYVIQ